MRIVVFTISHVIAVVFVSVENIEVAPWILFETQCKYIYDGLTTVACTCTRVVFLECVGVVCENFHISL